MCDRGILLLFSSKILHFRSAGLPHRFRAPSTTFHFRSTCFPLRSAYVPPEFRRTSTTFRICSTAFRSLSTWVPQAFSAVPSAFRGGSARSDNYYSAAIAYRTNSCQSRKRSGARNMAFPGAFWTKLRRLLRRAEKRLQYLFNIASPECGHNFAVSKIGKCTAAKFVKYLIEYRHCFWFDCKM